MQVCISEWGINRPVESASRDFRALSFPEPLVESPLLLKAKDAGKLCGCSERRWREWHTMGMIPAAVHIGRTIFWRVDEHRDWIKAGCPNRKKWIARHT